MRRNLFVFALALGIVFPTIDGSVASACKTCRLGSGSQDMAIGGLMGVGGMGGNPLHEGSSFESQPGADDSPLPIDNRAASNLIYGRNDLGPVNSAIRNGSPGAMLSNARSVEENENANGLDSITNGKIDRSLVNSPQAGNFVNQFSPLSPDSRAGSQGLTARNGDSSGASTGVVAAPEPGAIALLGLGLLAAIRYRRA